MYNFKEFLMHPPQVLSPEQKVCLEGIGHSFLGIEISFQRLKENSSKFTKKTDSTTDLEHAVLFVDAWSMVDHGHALIQLISRKKTGISSPLINQFIEENNAVGELRNSMDHLANNLKNISENKKNRTPISGVLGFVSAKPDETGKIQKGESIIVTSGSLREEPNLPLVNPLGRKITPPIGLFQLSAFEKKLDISKFYRDAMALRQHIENDLAPKIIDKIVAVTMGKNGKIEEALSPTMGGIHAMMTFENKSK